MNRPLSLSRGFSPTSRPKAVTLLSIFTQVSFFIAVCLLVGCQSSHESQKAPTAPNAAAIPKAADVIPARTAVRIDCGATESYTDSDGNVWLPDQGFVDGRTVARSSDLPIANTKDPALYRTERYGMTAFSWKLANGQYAVKLHFAETLPRISGPGQRVFSFKVQDQEYNDFDIFLKAGGARAAFVQTVNVDVTTGKLDVTFTPKVQNPSINAIEIIPTP